MFKKITTGLLSTFMIAHLMFLLGYGQVLGDIQDNSLNFLVSTAHADEDEEDDSDDDDEEDDNDDNDDEDDDRETRRERNTVFDVSMFQANEINQASVDTLTVPASDLTQMPVVISPVATSDYSNMLAFLASKKDLMDGITLLTANNPIDFYVDELAKREIVSQFDPIYYDRFSPASRIDALRLILNTSELSPDEISNYQAFSDVSNKSWIAAYVSTAKDKGIVKGYEDNSFKPLNNVKRGEVIKMLLEAYNVDLAGKYPTTKSFSDEDNLDWTGAYLETAKANNVIKGYENGTVGPDNFVTKGEVAKMVLLASKVSHDGGFVLPVLVGEIERSELLKQRELNRKMLEQAKNTQNTAPVIPSKPPVIPVAPVDTAAQQAATARANAARAAQVEQARIAAQQAATAKAIADAAAKAAQAEQARIAAQQAAAAKAAADAAARARARSTRHS